MSFTFRQLEPGEDPDFKPYFKITTSGDGRSWHQKAAQIALEEGNCTKCHNTPAEVGKKLCKSCNDYSRRYKAEKRKNKETCSSCFKQPRELGKAKCVKCLKIDTDRYAKNKELGLCKSCPVDNKNPIKEGYVSCEGCVSRVNADHKELREAGNCATCVIRKVEPGFKQCEGCRVKNQKYSQKLEDEGLCRLCLAPSTQGKTRCDECRIFENTRRTERIEEGMCISCGVVPPLKDYKGRGRKCFACLRNVMYSVTNKVKLSQGSTWAIERTHYESLVALDCYYCELPLERYLTCGGLDRLDNSRGYEPDNVVTCCKKCNIAKNDFYNPQEFKEYIAPGIRRYRLAVDFGNIEPARNPSSLPSPPGKV